MRTKRGSTLRDPLKFADRGIKPVGWISEAHPPMWLKTADALTLIRPTLA